jgi:hypothetical protein
MEHEERLIWFGCECGAAACDAKIAMTLAERDVVDHVNDRWAIAPGHQLQPNDQIVERHDRYWVVASPAIS